MASTINYICYDSTANTGKFNCKYEYAAAMVATAKGDYNGEYVPKLAGTSIMSTFSTLALCTYDSSKNTPFSVSGITEPSSCSKLCSDNNFMNGAATISAYTNSFSDVTSIKAICAATATSAYGCYCV